LPRSTVFKSDTTTVSNSDGKWALSGVVYEYLGPKSYLGLRDLLGVGFSPGIGVIDPRMISVMSVRASVDISLSVNISASRL